MVLVVMDMRAGHVVGDGVDEAQKMLLVADMGMARIQADAEAVVVEFADQREQFLRVGAVAVAACVFRAGVFVEKVFEGGMDAELQTYLDDWRDKFVVVFQCLVNVVRFALRRPFIRMDDHVLRVKNGGGLRGAKGLHGENFGAIILITEERAVRLVDDHAERVQYVFCSICLVFKIFAINGRQIVQMPDACVAAEFQGVFKRAITALTAMHDVIKIDAELHFFFLSMDWRVFSFE